jgi:hypothetical protein
MSQTGITKQSSPVNVSGNNRQGYLVDRNEMPKPFNKKGEYPNSIILLDAPAAGQFIEFGNRDSAITGLYFSRDYASVLKIVNR